MDSALSLYFHHINNHSLCWQYHTI